MKTDSVFKRAFNDAPWGHRRFGRVLRDWQFGIGALPSEKRTAAATGC